MQLEPGMRVRCVDPTATAATNRLERGAEYVVRRVFRAWGGQGCVTLEGVYGNWFAYRFKPVVRVKAPSVHTLDLMIKRASVWFDALSPEEQIAHREAQRASWARCEAELGVWERRYLDAHRAYLAGARYYSPVKRSEYQVAKGIWNA